VNHLLVQGDARRLPLADGSVHCVVTSPPYFSLRDYGTARWMGGDPGCDHAFEPDAGSTSARQGRTYQQGHVHRDCKCGATRVDSQLGLEATPEAYVAAMVRVFREVKRVLRDDGTAWVNLGDGFASGEIGRHDALQSVGACNGATGISLPGLARSQGQRQQARVKTGLGPKQLLMMPHRVALALQADGWIVRMDCVWSKPNPMPESVTDRPTKAHEYVFLLSKQERYYFDQEAIREKTIPDARDARWNERNGKGRTDHENDLTQGMMQKPRPDWIRMSNPAGRNIRSVWTIPSEAYPGAHFATFPRKLVAPCIKAGTSAKGVCSICSAPWERVTEIARENTRPGHVSASDYTAAHFYDKGSGGNTNLRFRPEIRSSTLGWRPTCSHDAPAIPATVFDPFAGSGTTGVVALALNRRFIGVDLSAKYLGMAERRISRPHARVARTSKPEALPLFAGLEE
jgi:DNA modification methylase